MSPSWRDQALERVEPTPQQEARVEQAAQELLGAVQRRLEEEGWEGLPRVEGSVAKGTFLRASADVDVFVAFPQGVARKELEDRVRTLGELLTDPVIAYAEHPYVQGTWESLPAEIVPCYAVDDPAEIASAVDRTPFHTDYILEHLDEADAREVRLLKAFLAGCEAYGAEESVLGFSGYLAELVVLRFGGLEAVLGWAVDGFEHPVALDPDAEPPEATDFEDPLVVIDPVDPGRNVAAAVTRATLQRVREAAAAFRAEPSASFFEPATPPRMTAERARQRCRARRSRVLAWAAPVPAEVLDDPAYAQLRRATRLVAEAIEREQVPVTATAVVLDGDRGWGLIEAQAEPLAEPKLHAGPPAEAEAHADRFRERWEDAADAASQVHARGDRLFVYRAREHGSLAEIARPVLEEADAGKLVNRALDDGTLVLHEGAQALDAMPPEALGRLLDRRRPWER